jgi:hypothetical protein
MKPILFIFALLFFASCVSEVDFPLPSTEKLVALNCILNPNADTVVAWVSYTKPVLSTLEFEAVKNARVNLFEDGKQIGEFVKSDSTAFVLPIKVKPCKNYRIEVVTENKLVWAETHVPENISADFEAIKNNQNSFDYKVSFKDNPGEENYYWISAKGFTWTAKPYYSIVDLLFSNYDLADDFNRTVDQFKGYLYDYRYYIRILDGTLPSDSVTVQFNPGGINIQNGPQEVFVLSVDYHLDKYMKSSLLMEENDWSAEDTPIIYSPFPVYSNIHGGTGIFGSFNGVSQKFSKD